MVGEALGQKFYQGKPCHFVAIGKGCTVYSKRPQDPCVQYKCAWLIDFSIPEWLKPEISNVIISKREIQGHSYLYLREAGSTISSKVLNWFFQYVLQNQLNAIWEVEGSRNWMGNLEFTQIVQVIQEQGKLD